MIKIYTSPTCLSCRKLKKFFNDNNIQYVEKNIIHHRLKREDIYKMLVSSENGFDDILSNRSKVYKENSNKLKNMKLNELIDFIISNPTILKRPIILNDYELQVGYDPHDVTIFLPLELREKNCDICD